MKNQKSKLENNLIKLSITIIS